MKTVTVASGKGGTGKTLVSTNLAWALSQRGASVRYVDADVEAPNGHLFLSPKIESETRSTVLVPRLKGDTCSGCGACAKFCAYNAIIALRDGVMVFDELCHSCGGCVTVCPDNELVEVARENGTFKDGSAGPIAFSSATLDIGEAMPTPLQTALLERAADASEGIDVTVVDAPPGTSCSAMTAVRDADLVVLVTEPTPFGQHDLMLSIGMVREMGRPFTVVINRADLGSDELREELERQSVEVIAEIPFDRAIAEACAEGELVAPNVPTVRDAVERIASALLDGEGGGTR